MTDFPDPACTHDLRGLLLTYLDFYRGVVAAKVVDLSPDDACSSRIPSGWTPAGLVNHLIYMERRWLHWGFAAEQVARPWGDDAADGDGWKTPSDPLDELLGVLASVGSRTREIVQAHSLTDRAVVGGRFHTEQQAPQLQWILLHVLQEYARHAGHLDIARELLDGSVGEEG